MVRSWERFAHELIDSKMLCGAHHSIHFELIYAVLALGDGEILTE